jgi:hypothetical protein
MEQNREFAHLSREGWMAYNSRSRHRPGGVVIGQGFTVAKRHVAMFCVGLCVALSVQMTIVVLDQLKHAFQIDHAPNALAGAVFDHGHHLKVEVAHATDHPDDKSTLIHEVAFAPHDHDGAPHSHNHDAAPHSHDHDAVPHAHEHDSAPQGFHTHDWLPQGHDHGPIGHHHHGAGMLTPWLVSASLQIAIVPVKIAVDEINITGHPDAPAWRRDRPPKLNLERIV